MASNIPPNPILSAIQSRRSQYQIGPECSLPHNQLNDLITHCIKHIPSMFNMQSTRAIVLYGEHHRYLWELVMASLTEEILGMRPNVAHEYFGTVREKVGTLRGGHGTILFFEDTTVVESVKERYPAYSAKFDNWSQQSAATAQYAIWTALANLAPDLGLTLQHYYPDLEKIRDKWDIPQSWVMTGQMPFGNITAPAVEKSFARDEELLRVFDA